MLEILRILLKPLIELLELGHDGEEIYQYLYFTRSGVENEVESAIIQGKHNITIIGKPGAGKTSLMHYMFIKLKKDGSLYPIILDYRKIAPKKPESLLALFVISARQYFEEIGFPVTTITAETTISNCIDQSMIVQKHLASIPFSKLQKKMVLFLDDLDYAEDQYMTILKDFFLPYAQTDKAFLILSVREPLLNTIKRYDQLRQSYHLHPREIFIPEDDFEFIVNNRLKTVLAKEEAQAQGFLNDIQKFLRAFINPTVDELIIRQLRRTNPDFTSETITLPFDGMFYSKLRNITYSNLRIVEELLPDMIQWESDSPSMSLNKNFYDAFLHIAIKKSHIIVDLVSDTTRDRKQKFNGNSILQNVLEYFYFEEVAAEYFYEEMAQFGISKELADNAIEMLVKTPYSMIVPRFIYLKDNSDVKCL